MEEAGKKGYDERVEAVFDEAVERLNKKLGTWNEKYNKFLNENVSETGRGKRMSNFNRIVLMGRLTRDPEVKQTVSGKSVADLGLAVSEVYKDKNGEFTEKTCFVDLVAWGRQAETCGEYLRKGSPVLVEGRLQLDRWVTQDGQKRSKHRVKADRVKFLSGGKQGADTPKREAEPVEEPAEALPF